MFDDVAFDPIVPGQVEDPFFYLIVPEPRCYSVTLLNLAPLPGAIGTSREVLVYACTSKAVGAALKFAEPGETCLGELYVREVKA